MKRHSALAGLYCRLCQMEEAQAVENIEWEIPEYSEIKASVLKEDMLRYLSKQPSESLNVLLNGVDHAIIDDKEYIEELRNQITRVVPKNGFAMGYNSPHLTGLKESDFEKIIEIPGYGKLKESNSEVASHGECRYRRK